MTTGARRGELCALRWRHLQVLHAERGDHDCIVAGCRWQLVIRRALCQGRGGRLWESDTKTHQRRHVALDAETVAVLVEHRHQCEQNAAAVGARLTGDSFIFSTAPDGTTPPKPSTLSQRYDRCAARLGITTTLKSLRHYSATELITAGVDVRTVAGRLGHSGGGVTTLRVYAAWMSAADQHACTALVNRMPRRPEIPDDPARAQTRPRWPHERVAAAVHAEWSAGQLAAGSELTVKTLTRTHGVSVGTAHRAITLLSQWGTVQVRNGNPTVILPQSAPDGTAADGTAAAELRGVTVTEPTADSAGQASTAAPVLRLELFHLGHRVRSLTARADPHDFDTLQRAAHRRCPPHGR